MGIQTVCVGIVDPYRLRPLEIFAERVMPRLADL